MSTDRNQRRLLEKQNAKLPPYLQRVPPDQWPGFKPPDLTEVWRSRNFLVQIYNEPSGYQRMSICRSVHNGDRWVDQVTWDELMRLKRECGRGDDHRGACHENCSLFHCFNLSKRDARR